MTSTTPTTATETITGLGRIGVWSAALHSEDPDRRSEIAEAAAELDELGYGTIWVGGSPSPDDIATVLAATDRATVGSSIMSIWQHEAAAVAARHAELSDAHGDRFVLGLGVSHAEFGDREDRPFAGRPYSEMAAYLDALDAAPRPVPAARRALAALGPKMLRLSRDRSLGALPYLTTVEQVAEARTALGTDALLAPELMVVLDPDLARARATARGYLAGYLGLVNYTNNFRRLGFGDDDFTGGGSDRLLDAVFALGDAPAIRERVDAFLAAGANHLAIQVVTEDTRGTLPRTEWRVLSETLL
ncbi:TIGR03620 family F420-dependent LLM class oxidoreductase [Streptomyces sp. NPDC057654]|uniref:TIGR03620 family F420-dependent LLM class oxidoreductase n=1 Tax=Streptomyces sp. NPDC057654 TaxID=3346196 RepID=UPI00369E1C60